MGVGGAGDGGCFGDAYGDIDRACADVGQVLDTNVPLERDGKVLVVPIEVLKAGGTVFGHAEPRAVAEGVAPGPEFIETRYEILANGAGNRSTPCR